MSLKTLLFVYGTLKRGGELHSELASQKVRYLGSAKIKGRLFLIEGESYPGAVETDSKEYIKGELYELTDPAKTLAKLDEVEGCDEGLFARKLVDGWLGAKKIKTWA
ncbi:MAG TPA: gamma-glutamylcyclotransferase family protein, partial [Candidatus Solibacter sp.]|nr:gamma-glutamylcyclotransferase family protein [Candidatus Solibacter sp.]